MKWLSLKGGQVFQFLAKWFLRGKQDMEAEMCLQSIQQLLRGNKDFLCPQDMANERDPGPLKATPSFSPGLSRLPGQLLSEASVSSQITQQSTGPVSLLGCRGCCLHSARDVL